MFYYDIRCNVCGRFCKPVDSGFPHGTYSDEEPPDEVFFCKECVDKKIENPYSIIIGCWYIRPNYVAVAKSIIRHYREN